MTEKQKQKRWYGITKKKRMFSIDVVDTDKFLDMPHSTRELWWQCGMRADDDGFVSDIKKILKVTNTSFDDVQILIAKGFLLNLHKNIYLIVHWNLCNSVRKDTYTPSLHKDLLKNVVQTVQGTYEYCHTQLDMFGNQELVQRNDIVPQLSKDKLSKDKSYICSNLCKSQFEQFWKEYPKKKNKKRARTEWEKAEITTELFDQIMEHLRERKKTTWIKQNNAFVVYPERFIKNEAWEDDISDYDPYVEEESGSMDLTKK